MIALEEEEKINNTINKINKLNPTILMEYQKVMELAQRKICVGKGEKLVKELSKEKKE